MITPYTAAGTVDEPGLRAMARFLIEGGVHGLHPCGTTGEAPLLSVAERKLVAETVIDAAGGQVPVIIQVGHMHAGVAAELAQHAADSGADAISVVTPYYYALPERALLSYFRTVIRAVPATMPVYLYNIPQCTANPVSAQLLGQLMTEFPNLVGIKHSQNDVVWLAEYQEAAERGAQVFVGSDSVALAGLSLGAHGIVSGNANVFPELFVRLYHAVTSQQLQAARTLQTHISHLAGVLGNGSSLASFKEAASRRGVPISNAAREPLAALSEDEAGRVTAVLAYAEQHALLTGDGTVQSTT